MISSEPHIHHAIFLPREAVRGVVLLVHGLAEHSGRYRHVIAALNQQGVAVYTMDLPGHGLSASKRMQVSDFYAFTDALAALHRRARAEQVHAPVFVLGHSMGGLIATRYVIDHSEDIQGLILSAPALQLSPEITVWRAKAVRWLGRWVPTLGVSGLDFSNISRDQEVVRAYRADPLVHHGKTPVSLVACLLVAVEALAPDLRRLSVPFLVLQGGADRLVHSEGARLLMREALSADKQLRWYDRLFHEVFNEPEREQVIGDVLDWLKPRLSTA